MQINGVPAMEVPLLNIGLGDALAAPQQSATLASRALASIG
jgi:hypothetical protein